MKAKRMITLFLTLIMVLSMMAGCGKSNVASYKDNPEDEVTLTVAFTRAKQEDADKVIAEVNKKLETLLPNTKITAMYEPEMRTKWPLLMATKTSIDLYTGTQFDIEEEAAKGTILNLNDLIKEYGPNIQELQEKYWYSYDTGTINGKTHAIPNVQIYIQEALSIELMFSTADKNVGITAYTDTDALVKEAWANEKTTERFWQIIDEGLEKATAAGVDCKGKVGTVWYQVAQRGYHFIGGENSNICYDNSDDVKIIDFYQTEEFAAYCKYMKKWAEKGFVSPDILTGELETMWCRPTSLLTMNKDTGELSSGGYVLTNPEERILTADIGSEGAYWCIPFTSKNPARAMKFLDLLHSEKGAEIANLLAYGIEGEHYEFVDKEKGEIKAFEYEGQGSSGVSYGIPNWMISNMLQGMYEVYPYTNEYSEYADNYYNNTLKGYKKHTIYGFSFDTSSVKTQMSNIIKNNSEMAANVYSGVLPNGDAILADLNNKNTQAGIETVIKEFQKQVDEFMASK